ncbi:MAG: DUF5788 family protein [Candidatus Atabeyarchaeum deiterrae]
MKRLYIIRKLASPFSYLTVEIPTEVEIGEQRIDLKRRIAAIVKVAEGEDPAKVVPEVVQLENVLTKLLNEFAMKVEKSEIELAEAESQLDYYLGIKRAIVILRGISDESLRRFNEEDLRESTAEDRKRWFRTTKKLAGS